MAERSTAYCDDTAALAFLKSQGVRVPQEISVIGMDDTLDALNLGLTSYAFPVVPVTHAVVDHVLRPQPAARGAPAAAIEMQGQVVTRKTTGPARGPGRGAHRATKSPRTGRIPNDGPTIILRRK